MNHAPGLKVHDLGKDHVPLPDTSGKPTNKTVHFVYNKPLLTCIPVI